MPSLTLALDTSADACAVALLGDGRLLAAGRKTMVRGHAEALVPMIMAVMKEAGEEIASLRTIGVTVGPGSFTGIRAGIATARGLALASAARAVGVSTLEAVACGALASVGKPVMCILDTRRDDYFVQQFDAARTPLCAPAALDGAAVAERLDGFVLAGNAVARFLASAGIATAETAPDDTLPFAADVARLAEDVQDRDSGLAPLYLGPAHAVRDRRQR